MTYEEYKNKGSKKSLLKSILSKLYTVIVFTLLILIISNVSPKFKTFIKDKVLESTIDFSFINKLTSKTTDIFKSKETVPVFDIKEEKYEEYMDGYKFFNDGSVILKDSGIVTFIGEKDDYGNVVVIQQSNGYYAWYGNIDENIKLYDYVEEGSAIGTSKEYYYYVILKEDEPITLDEY